MRFEVPQFIDVEDKIFGPLTFKQFIYLAGGVGLAYVSYKLVPAPISWILALAFVILGLLLAFYKVNSRTFIEIAQAFGGPIEFINNDPGRRESDTGPNKARQELGWNTTLNVLDYIRDFVNTHPRK